MSHINGKTILIGRDPEKSNLLVAVYKDKTVATDTLGNPGCVPNSVSRCKKQDKDAHCKIEVGPDGSLMVSCLKDNNPTYVNGMEIISMPASPLAVIELSPTRFRVEMQQVLAMAENLAAKLDAPATPNHKKNGIPVETAKKEAVDISHLANVWADLNEGRKDIKKRAQSRGKMRMLPLMLGTLSSILAAVLGSVGGSNTLFITVPVAVACFVFYLVMMLQKDDSVEREEALMDDFKKGYRCPSCNKFLGNTPYDLLSENSACPYCKSPWVK